MCKALAESLLRISRRHIEEQGVFTLALAGGNTPKELYRHMAAGHANKFDWKNIHLFIGDERYVPATDPHSNQAMVCETLISKIDLPDENFHPIPVRSGKPASDAARYDKALKDFFEDLGTFDLILLGIGGDGHTASLFPGSSALKDNRRWAAAVKAPQGYEVRDRITLTLNAINLSKKVYFMVSGQSKHDVFKKIQMGEPDPSRPASMVHPAGDLTWFVDFDLSA